MTVTYVSTNIYRPILEFIRILTKEKILFPDIDFKAMGLYRRERALYALLLCQGKDVINLNIPESVDALERYNRLMKCIRQRYSLLMRCSEVARVACLI